MTRLAALALLLAATAPALGQQCEAHVAPIKQGTHLSGLSYSDFGTHREIMIETPTQPDDLSYRLELDFEPRDDILLLPGLDDLVLSLTPPDGDLALSADFIEDLLGHDLMRVSALRGDLVEEEVEYDLRALALAVEACRQG